MCETPNNTSLVRVGAESAAENVGTFFVDRALNAVVDSIKKTYGEAQILLGTAFERYLKNATLRYNQVRTLATGTTPRSIIGKGNIYVSIGVRHGKKKISTDTVDPILRVSNNVIILGTGGTGKSMLMRYLFLNTAYRGEYVPVLLELRKISNQPPGNISILELIYSCMNDFDVQLPREQFEYSLRLGKYIFLLDGFDEIKESHAAETAAAIQSFCSKYPKNPCIITSRPRKDTSPLETFTTVKSLPLSKEQAVQLASKIWEEDEKTTEFCRQLNDGLYEKHKDFAENPLLLSMMFLTFMRNNSVPNHLAEFYSKAYDALYSAHDSNDKGYYRREFRCKELDEAGFKAILSHFCFRTYFKQDYEFTKEQIISYLNTSIQKFEFDNVTAAEYLEDLRNVVCLLVEDGDIYRFAHRSFQAYFAACYTSSVLTDEQQRKLFYTKLSGAEIFWSREDYYTLLAQIEHKRFTVNVLEDCFRDIKKKLASADDPDLLLIKLQYRAISVTREKDNEKLSRVSYYVGSEDDNNYYYNVLAIFRKHILKLIYRDVPSTDEECIIHLLGKVSSNDRRREFHGIDFTEIDSSDRITDEERHILYDAIARRNKTQIIRESVTKWLADLDLERQKLASADFIDEL